MSQSPWAPVGSLGATRLVRIDGRGRLRIDDTPVTIDWWVGASDRWRRASDEAAVRQARAGAAPVYETAMRVPDGDVTERVFGLGGAGGPVVVEIENASAAPVVLALVVEGAPTLDARREQVELPGRCRMRFTRPPAAVIGAANLEELAAALDAGREGGGVGSGPTALLLPVSHRTRVRVALELGPPGGTELDLVGAPGADAAVTGWAALLDRGMRVSLSDESMQLATDRARADLLLESARPRASIDVFGALEDWGFDTEAATVWRRLGWRDRRAAARRPVPTMPAAAHLRATRDSLLQERAGGDVVLLAGAPGPGEAVEVLDAPLRAGTLSFVLRWHGARPALLWEVRDPRSRLRLRAPALDPSWSSSAPAGEALLAPATEVSGR